MTHGTWRQWVFNLVLPAQAEREAEKITLMTNPDRNLMQKIHERRMGKTKYQPKWQDWRSWLHPQKGNVYGDFAVHATVLSKSMRTSSQSIHHSNKRKKEIQEDTSSSSMAALLWHGTFHSKNEQFGYCISHGALNVFIINLYFNKDPGTLWNGPSFHHNH